MVGCDPILDVVIVKTSQDLPDLLGGFNVSSIKVSKAGLFVFAHNRWIEITGKEDRNF